MTPAEKRNGPEDLRQQQARKQGFRGICIICGKPIDKTDNYALIYKDSGFDHSEGPAHEDCLTHWQNPPETPEKE